jgi:hypothetical protein
VRVTPTCDPINDFVICNASGTQLWPDVAFDGTNYLVVWTDRRSGSYYRVYGSRVTPQGVVLNPNGFAIGPANSKNQYRPSLIFTGTRYLVVWGYATSPYAVTGRWINTDGSLGDTIQIAPVTGTYPYNNRIASDGTYFLVVWAEYNASGAPIRGQLVTSDGTPIGNTFTVTTSAYYYNSLGCRFDGTNYIVTWASASGTRPVYGQKYDTRGDPVGGPFEISNTSNYCYYNDVCPGTNNRYLNVWSERVGSYYDVYANLDVEIIGVEERTGIETSRIALKSTIVKNTIQLTGAEGIEVSIFDASGRKIGTTYNGTFNCQGLGQGVYFVNAAKGGSFKVVKIK